MQSVIAGDPLVVWQMTSSILGSTRADCVSAGTVSDGSVELTTASITGWYQAGYAEAVAEEAVAMPSPTPESSSSQDCRLDGAPGC